MLLRDALLAYAHFLAILFLTAVLCTELAVYRQELAAPVARRLQRIDLFFGIAAVVVIVTGVARVIFGLKGAEFYLHNPIFWTKMGLFLLVGLLSIPPTVHFLRWNASLSAGADAIRTSPDLRAHPLAARSGDRRARVHPALCRAHVAWLVKLLELHYQVVRDSADRKSRGSKISPAAKTPPACGSRRMRSSASTTSGAVTA